MAAALLLPPADDFFELLLASPDDELSDALLLLLELLADFSPLTDFSLVTDDPREAEDFSLTLELADDNMLEATEVAAPGKAATDEVNSPTGPVTDAFSEVDPEPSAAPVTAPSRRHTRRVVPVMAICVCSTWAA